MRLNMFLLVLGTVLIGFAAYRMGVIKFDRKFYFDLLPNLIIAVGLMIYLYRVGGTGLVYAGATQTAKITLGFLPLLIVVFWTIGEAGVLVNMHKDWIKEFLSGKYGLVGAFFAAMIMPSSMTGLPIVADLWEKGADKATLMVFVVVSSLIGMQIVMFRQPMLGWKITGVYLLCGVTLSIFFALLMGWWRTVKQPID